MRLTSFTDFGLRVLMRLAAVPGAGASTAELATELGISRNHLAKVVQALARAGYLATRRGGGGGVMLAHAPADIRMGEVVRTLEQGQALVECLAQGPSLCTLDGCCRMKHRLRAAEEAFLAELNRSTLAQIALPRVGATTA
ncbi:MAG: Rrf2 family transcriptional regulator [Rubellimicrobium sp.]|nr:Rrf2 family transcriptional regulator [Rubellimicrobium sp.]